ncbi:hypothetical protein HDA32_005727 [Spinactinospora alkalitolerans]|uniref:Uncharacterized protein n=1 Tax=Spinactinospora alkalitolerans TaxID=687207 RepID=A0A852U4S1_9ACTN|nr:hypothetical protein [Spinactinospora alkalitolerans]NYE50607.1 hypothetical protein [Spinactinospora alkalitolerans]
MRLIRTLYASLFEARRRPNQPPPRHARTPRPPGPVVPPARSAPPASRKSAVPEPRPRQAERLRSYAAAPVAVADSDRFGEVGARHRHRRHLAYAPGQAAPYQAHHRTRTGIVPAAGDPDTLDFALTAFTPPSYARPYLDRRPDSAPARGRPITAGVT